MDNISNASNTSGGQVGRTDDDSNMSADGDDVSNDAEGVWSADIEQSFQEALAIYPPCGRRKIILSDEGKMYGRNELIARYIKLRTGKMRSRKQVSSHIQVMARRKAKEIQAQLKDQASKDQALQALSSMSSAQIISATAIQPVPGSGSGKSVIPPFLYPQMSPLGTPYSAYTSSVDQGTREWVVQSMAAMSSAQIVSAAALRTKTPISSTGLTNNITVTGLQSSRNSLQQPWSSNAVTQDVKPIYGIQPSCLGSSTGDSKPVVNEIHPAWVGRSIAGPRLRMVEFSAFLEQQLHPDTDAYNKHLFVHIGSNVSYADPQLEAVDIRQIADKFPDKRGGLKELYDKGPQSAFFLVKFWADINVSVQSEAGNFYGVSSLFESTADMTIQCSTKVCSFGKQVVEKVETEYSHVENGRYVYGIHRSPMCEYMINFILKLKQLPEKYMMNSVLENFTVLQVVINRDTNETLLCIAYVFEVSTSEHGAQHHIYRLVRD